MPGATPRGYPYPLYADPQDTRQAIEDFAEAVDLDVEALADQVTGALNRPSVAVSSVTPQAVAVATTASLTWSTSNYDNDAMAALPGGIVLNDSGIYLLTARITLDVTVTAALNSAAAWFLSSVGFIGRPSQMSITGMGTHGKVLNLFALHYTTGAAPDTISVQVRHTDPAGVNFGARNLNATKMSNLLSGS